MSSPDNRSWRFLTNHMQVLLCIARDRDVRIRQIAELVGITERAAQRIVTDLVEAGYLEVERIGRRSRYTVHPLAKMRHEAQSEHEIGELLELLALDDLPEEPSRA